MKNIRVFLLLFFLSNFQFLCEKYPSFFYLIFSFLEVKFSIYLNRRGSVLFSFYILFVFSLNIMLCVGSV